MNRLFRVGALSFAVAGLAACSSMSGSVAHAPAAPEPGSVTTDEAYVAEVEQAARRNGIEVQWINPPVKRVASNPR